MTNWPNLNLNMIRVSFMKETIIVNENLEVTSHNTTWIYRSTGFVIFEEYSVGVSIGTTNLVESFLLGPICRKVPHQY